MGVDEVELVGKDGRHVTHLRQPPGGRSIDYRHYLPELARKPQAVRQIAAELIRDLGSPFRELWRELVEKDGPLYAARIFSKLLESIVQHGRAAVVARIEQARSEGVPILLALSPPTKAVELSVEQIPVSLLEINVVASRACDYDRLLGGLP
ncbi:MAG TPA: hypothetical protein VGF45_17110 [Polyangia bacterium]